MGFFRRLGRWAGVGLWLGVPLIAFALLPAALLDRGPAGEVRPTLFPVALVTLDPFVWACAQNSFILAAVVSLISLVLGLSLAHLVTNRRFWGRPILIALGVSPLVVPPVVGALGLRLMLGPWLDTWASSGNGRWFGWSCWAWVASAVGTPVVGLATASALARLEPGWADAARLAGASRLRAWRKMVWPFIRPSVASAAATVFTLTLLEPGAPILLGLRRTLAYQAIEALGSDAPFPRAAILASMSVTLAMIARLLFRWWGGPAVTLPPPRQEGHAETLSWSLAIPATVVLAVAVALSWLPALAVLALTLRPSAAGRVDGLEVPRALAAYEAWHMVGKSIAVGLTVVALQLLMVAGLAANRGSPRRLPRYFVNWPEAFPPLALGIGALSLPWLLRLAVATLQGRGQIGVLGRLLRWLEFVLTPSGYVEILLAVAVAVSLQPLLAGALGVGRGGFDPTLYQVALSHGATRRRARRLATGLAFANSPGLICLVFSLAATNLAPALVLTSRSTSRTIGPGLIDLVDQPGGGWIAASRLGTLILIANISTLAFAIRGWHRSAGRWLRPAP